MESCTFMDFIQVLKPWLDRQYIRKGFIDKGGNFRLFFSDGGEKTYHIDDCSESRLKEVFAMMTGNGIPVEKER
jgi:hypothetical protein